MRFLLITCLSILSLFTNLVNAQVTIGSDSKPLEGALLDLKEHDTDTDNVTSTKGLLLPRVELTEIGSLKDIEGADLSNPLQYKGLLIYNVPDNKACGKPSGLYAWNGNKWINVAGEEAYDIPSSQKNDIHILKQIMIDNPGHGLDWVIDDSDPNNLKWISGSGVSLITKCGQAKISSLTITNNTNIKTINLAGANEMVFLTITKTNLATINLSNTPKLNSVSLSYNKLTSLDVTNSPEIFSFDCAYNKIKSLDLSKNVKMKFAICVNNTMTNLNVVGATSLEVLDCKENNLTSLDLSTNLELNRLDCINNKLTSLSPKSPKLKEINCMYNELTNLDISANSELTELYAAVNKFNTLNTSNNTKLESLSCQNNTQIRSLDLSTNTKLKVLNLDNAQLIGFYSDLDLSNNIELETLVCSGTWMFRLDLTKNNKLKHLTATSSGTSPIYEVGGIKICQSTYDNMTTLIPSKGDAIYTAVSCP